jgi:hypothetical protein
MRRAGATAVGEQPALFWDWGTAGSVLGLGNGSSEEKELIAIC